jgi:geranylgeranyl diphosphate synthase type II
MDIETYIKNKKKLIDKALDRLLPSLKTRPEAIHRAMRYAVFPGGKRIRPIITLASFEACGGKGNMILQVACAIELIHSYTLIHDDLPCMDDDDYRRGRPSCHKKFNEAIALLAGDALLTLSFELLSEACNADIIKEVSKAIGSCGTIGGQVVDIAREMTETRAQKPDLDYIAAKKTGELFRVAAKVGGMFKGISKNKIKALDEFGRYIGFTFQLVDDLIDKDGYVRIYGDRHTKNMAGLLTRKAKIQLIIFGTRAYRLLEIADLILKRRS